MTFASRRGILHLPAERGLAASHSLPVDEVSWVSFLHAPAAFVREIAISLDFVLQICTPKKNRSNLLKTKSAERLQSMSVIEPTSCRRQNIKMLV
jgi:hypothetical protein